MKYLPAVIRMLLLRFLIDKIFYFLLLVLYPQHLLTIYQAVIRKGYFQKRKPHSYQILIEPLFYNLLMTYNQHL